MQPPEIANEYLTEPLLQDDQAYIWHPFTPQIGAPQSIAIRSAAGAELITTSGRHIIDAVSSWWVTLHGHAQPEIAQAIAKQALELEQVIFAGFTHQPAVELVKRLLPHMPKGHTKGFYSDNGSTSVEVALKIALQYWANLGTPKKKVIALDGAYHGDTFGAMSVGSRSAFNAPFAGLLFDVEFLPFPEEANIETACAQLEQLVENGEVAAFIYEPLVQGSAGMRMCSPALLDRLLKIAQQNEVLLIADEVMTGFYRTGKFLASHYCATLPDLVCLSKGITGGFMPLGLTTCTEKIYSAFLSDNKYKMLFHGHSYTANPLACAAALASLDLLMKEETLTAINSIEAQHAAFAHNIIDHSKIKQVRQQGTILALELKVAEGTSYFSTIRDQLYTSFLEQNILLRPLGNIIYILPPYCITGQQLHKVYTAIKLVLDNM